MRNVLGIIGAGVLGQHIAHYAKLSGTQYEIVYFDDTYNLGSHLFGEIVGKISDVYNSIKSGEIQNLLIGIGYKHMKDRKSLYEEYSSSIFFPNIIHPTCYIDETVYMGNGNVILPGCIIDKGCKIGNNIFLNPGCIIAHNNNIRDHSYFGPGVKTSSYVDIGYGCFLGTGTNTIDNISISDNISTGAGTVIQKDITEPGIYIGNPARKLIS